jgi:hypothetical protein
MNNYREKLDNLYFHDSSIESILIEDGDLFDRRITIIIKYYNWEGNTENSETWIQKTLQLTINHGVHLQVNAPNLMEHPFEIMSEEYDIMYDSFIKKALEEKNNSYYIHLRSKQLDNFLSVKFNTNNYADSLFNESAGFIWIAGFNVEHEWLDQTIESKKHISIR